MKRQETGIGKGLPMSERRLYKANMSDFSKGSGELSTYSHYPQRKKKRQKERNGCYGFLIAIFVDLIRSLV